MKENHHEIIMKNIDTLLKEKNISISKLEKSLGISNVIFPDSVMENITFLLIYY